MTDILGVSHLVMATDDRPGLTAFFAERGYRATGINEETPSAPARAKFVSGDMAPTTGVTLMTGERGMPALELISEECAIGHPTDPEPAFSWIEGMGDTPDLARLRAALDERAGTPVRGYFSPNGAAAPIRSLAIAIKCPRVDGATALWQAIGIPPRILDAGLAIVDVPRTLAGAPMRLYLIADPGFGGKTWLNQKGPVCVALLCKNADALQESLGRRGFDVGQCFDLEPFGQPLRIFLMRNHAGELYEFLSVPQTRAA